MFFRYDMFIYSCYLCYVLSLYPFTERYAQPYFFSCFDTAEDVIRQALHLDDAHGVECLPNEEIFTELTRMGYEKPPPKTAWNEFSCSMASVVICLATVGTRQNFSSIGDSQAQEEGQKVREEEEIKVFWFKEGRITQEDVSAATKDVNVVEPTVFDDEKVTMTMAQTLIKMKSEKARLLDDQMAKRLHDEEVEQVAAKEKQEKDDLEKDKGHNNKEPQKKRVVEETLLQESFKKLKAVDVSGSDSTQETPTNDPKEMSEEDVQNMLEIVPVSEFKVEALYVKYPLIDWDIHSKGSISYWKIIRVGGITVDMLKGFDKEDLVALWSLVKEKFSTTVPTVDKEKALWVELTRLFEPNTDDVFWKLQRYMHDPLTWKLYTNYRVHHVSSTRRHDIFMLTEKDYPLSNVVMIMMLSAKLQVEEDSEMARDLVMKILIEANKPKSKSLDTSSK
nr:hypothetical protein [Tanacetum cinerariifolium]